MPGSRPDPRRDVDSRCEIERVKRRVDTVVDAVPHAVERSGPRGSHRGICISPRYVPWFSEEAKRVASETIRTPIVFPKALVEAVDDLVGQRKRSAFVAEAVAEKVERERRGVRWWKRQAPLTLTHIRNGRRGR